LISVSGNLKIAGRPSCGQGLSHRPLLGPAPGSGSLVSPLTANKQKLSATTTAIGLLLAQVSAAQQDTIDASGPSPPTTLGALQLQEMRPQRMSAWLKCRRAVRSGGVVWLSTHYLVAESVVGGR
jgi:hypothetical protein